MSGQFFSRSRSVPDISFVEFDSVFGEERAVFFLEGAGGCHAGVVEKCRMNAGIPSDSNAESQGSFRPLRYQSRACLALGFCQLGVVPGRWPAGNVGVSGRWFLRDNFQFRFTDRTGLDDGRTMNAAIRANVRLRDRLQIFERFRTIPGEEDHRGGMRLILRHV